MSCDAGRSRRPDGRPPGIVIAGGGTGGHLFPGIAIADAFREENPAVRVLFVSIGRSLEVSALAEKGYNLARITAAGIKGKGRMDQLRAAVKIPLGVLESVGILKRFHPDAVIGVGGYSSGPVVLAAWLLRIPIVLHEQNIIPGLTNRVLSRLADRLCLSFARMPSGIPAEKVIVTGNPVRREILDILNQGPSTPDAASSEDNPFTVLVIGGSQGARRINTAVLEALEYIREKDRVFIIHQTGESDEQRVRRGYSDAGMNARVQAFFTDMARQYTRADLVICRAGATTTAEITAAGKPAVFIPFPFAADNHQELNARSLSDCGAAELILENRLSGKRLAERIEYFRSDRQALDRMASRAHALGRPDAARVIVDECRRLINRSHDA